MTDSATHDNEGSSLLLVQDDLLFARAVARSLGDLGYAVDVAATSDAARRRVCQCFYRRAILDLRLPDGSGLALAEELLEARHVANVVFFTSEPSPLLLRRAAMLGPVVTKQTGAEALLGFIAGWGKKPVPLRRSGFIRLGDGPAAKARYAANGIHGSA